jgi:hypothetical protein
MANFQSITQVRLGQLAMTASYQTLYTVPANTRTFVKDIDIINTTSASIGVYVHIVPSGGTAGTSNAVFYNNALPGNTTVQWTGSQIMNTGDTIQVKASTTGCTVTASGGEGV